MAVLFTFGCGTLGELGTNRPDDTRRPESVAVAFPQTAPKNGAGEININSIALGNDHSLAAVGGSIYRWGLLGANVDMRPRRTSNAHWASAAGSAARPEVVPTPTALSRLVDVRLQRTAEMDESGGLEGQVCAVAGGGSNSFFLTSSGEVFMLGNLRPPGGDSDCVRHLWGNLRGGPPSRVVKIAAGWRHCLLLTEVGSLFALGDDEHGQCAGINSGMVAIPLPTEHAVVGISAGACHSGAWDCTGSAFTWGHAGSGRLGLDGTCNRRTPARVHKLLEPVHRVSCGANFTFFVTNYGRSLWACGGNQYGQLGLGGADRSPQAVPVRVGFPRADDSVIDLQCGANHVLCITSSPVDTTGNAQHQPVVWAWGCASSGQCGRAEGEHQGTAPPAARSAPEALVDFVAPSPHWAIAVAAGRSHSAVVAHKGRPARISDSSSPVVRRAQRQLPEPPMASPERLLSRLPCNSRRLPDVPGTIRKLPMAPSASSPELGSSSKAMSASPVRSQASMSPMLVSSPPGSRSSTLRGRQEKIGKDETMLVEDDIIDMFCARLQAHSTPPMRAARNVRSTSPMEGLVRLGEAALSGDAQATMEDQAFDNSNADFVLHRSGSRRMVATGAAVHQWNLRASSRSQTPPRQHGELDPSRSTWPRPPSSWAAGGGRRSPLEASRRGQRERESISQERRSSRDPPSAQGCHSSPSVSPVLGQPSWVANSFAAAGAAGSSPPGTSALGAAALRFDAMLPSPPPVDQDKWTGVHESLKGLTSMIAKFSAPPMTTSALPARDLSTSGGSAGDLAAGSRHAEMVDEKKLDMNLIVDPGKGCTTNEDGHHLSSPHGYSMHRDHHLLAFHLENPTGGHVDAERSPQSFHQKSRNLDRGKTTHAVQAQSPSGLLDFDQGDPFVQADTPGDSKSETAFDFSPRSTGSASFCAQEQMRSGRGRGQAKGRLRGHRSNASSRPAIPPAPPAISWGATVREPAAWGAPAVAVREPAAWGAPTVAAREPAACPDQSIEHSMFLPSPGPVSGTAHGGQASPLRLNAAFAVGPAATLGGGEEGDDGQYGADIKQAYLPWASQDKCLEPSTSSAVSRSLPSLSLPPLHLEKSSGSRIASTETPSAAAVVPVKAPSRTPPRTPTRRSPRQSNEVSGLGSRATAAASQPVPLSVVHGVQDPAFRQSAAGSYALGVAPPAEPPQSSGTASSASVPAGPSARTEPSGKPDVESASSSTALSVPVSFGERAAPAASVAELPPSKRDAEDSSPFVMEGGAVSLVPGLDPDSDMSSSTETEEAYTMAPREAAKQQSAPRQLSNSAESSSEDSDDDDEARGKHHVAAAPKKNTVEDSSLSEPESTGSEDEESDKLDLRPDGLSSASERSAPEKPQSPQSFSASSMEEGADWV
mmetsp:Transcript_136079/g.261374  ORF Transcript_136079/g.261374 Transcript_136079/m.261374 type:complete len:1391 (+) Transcript_136079:127-4299(+)